MADEKPIFEGRSKFVEKEQRRAHNGEHALRRDSIETRSGRLCSGSMIDERYKIVSELGHGGMGTVYLVEQVFLRAEFALKMLTQDNLPEAALRRFKKEAQAAGSIDHPGVVKVHDFGTVNGHPYFVMDLVRGESLADRIKRAGAISIDETLHIFIQLCFVLQCAHEKGIIHRDLKPSNIMLSEFENGGQQIKIVDFGIAKILNDEESALTKTGEIFGSPFYMSPEQCVGIGVDQRTDIYALGCVMFEALTGLPPFLSDTALAVMMKHQGERPPTLREASLGKIFPENLESVVAKLLQKEPEKRYQTMLTLASDLNRIASGRGVQISRSQKKLPNAARSGLGSSPSRISLVAAVCAMSLCALVGFSSAMYIPASSFTPARGTASGALFGIMGSSENPGKAQGSYSADIDSQQTRFSSMLPAEAPGTEAQPAPERVNGPTRIVDVTKKYSTIIDSKTRNFRFPKESIGRLSICEAGRRTTFRHGNQGVLTIPVEAQGDVLVNNFAPLKLELWQEAGPEAIAHFRSDDLMVLELKKNTAAQTLFGLRDSAYINDLLKYVTVLKSLQSLEISRVPVTDNCLKYLTALPNLTALNVGQTVITGGAVSKLPQLGRLVKLRVGQIINAKMLLASPKLRNSRTMTELEAFRDSLDTSDLKCISEIKNLYRLDIASNSQIKLSDLCYLQDMPKLEHLSVDHCDLIRADSAAVFKRFRALRVLVMTHHRWPASDMATFVRAVAPIQVHWAQEDLEGNAPSLFQQKVRTPSE